jgi:hypothetical protein
MNILNTAEILKEVAGGLHLAHHSDDKNAEETVKEKTEEMTGRVSDAFADLTANEHHTRK